MGVVLDNLVPFAVLSGPNLGLNWGILRLVRDFIAYGMWVSGAQKCWPAQNRWFICTSVRSQDGTALSNSRRRKKSSAVPFFYIKNQDSIKAPISKVFFFFLVRGAGQDWKVRRFWPAPGCTGVGFLSWGWFWTTWYPSRCFPVLIWA
jgi:hypothetical protein